MAMRIGAKDVFRFLPAAGFYALCSFIREPPPHDEKALRKVALARGLNGVDELLANLGESASKISEKEARVMLKKQVGIDGFVDKFFSSDRKRRCESLLNEYIKVRDSTDPTQADVAKLRRTNLVKSEIRIENNMEEDVYEKE